jgi:hypothetical protein
VTSKRDFTDEEWELVREAPTSAGMIVAVASRGGTFRESFSMAKAFAEVREQHGQSELLDDVASERPKVDRERAGSGEEFKQNRLQAIRDTMALLEAKSTSEEADAYRRFVLSLANRVAEAHREDGEQVSEAERQALTEIEAALG